MSNDTIVSFSDPAFRDELSDLVRDGARRIIRQAVEAELRAFIDSHAADRDAAGRRAVVRNGYQPEREVLTGVGPVSVRVPKTRDRAGEGRCFRSELLPPYLKKTRRLEAVIPWLYLKGVSTNDVDEALRALFGDSVKGLSPSTIARLKRGWEAEYADWRQRDWRGHEFVYLWADGIYVNVRADERRCVLVVVGCDVHGRKHFLAIEDGFRESAASWKAVLLSLKDRGLDAAKLAVGDGALGFWAALAEVYPTTRTQRCWVHKTANVLNKLPKSLHPDAKPALHEIWQAESREAAEKAFDRFIATYQAKYPKAVECLVKDRTELLAFYDFPAAHWQHVRTTNPIESTFATIRLRTRKTRNCVSAKSGLSLMHQLAMSAQKRWRRLRGFRHLADLVAGIQFIDGVDEREISRKAA
ncbi:MAG TPA: IS256 family transposase [Gammaproteobacteria bacterium]|nr:IS256 family transposase [Gammaproteobacteria bacterium]